MSTEQEQQNSRPTLRLTNKGEKSARDDDETGAKPQLPRQFVTFTFYKARPEWRHLGAREKEEARREFVEAVGKYGRELFIHTYSIVGLRSNVDFMVWRIGYALDPFQQMSAELNATALGRHLDVTQSFLSMTKRSMYIDKDNPEHVEDRLHIVPGQSQYLFVYPFVKTRDWYMLPVEQRQELMDEHIRVGSKYRSVKLHTTYSFGLDDQEFVVAFETDHPADFLDLVQELRETRASKYTLRDTPMYTCRKLPLAGCLEALG
ncbi:MAG TPA: chlorite dismutase family protein [Pyrinomonadaceae bacterium]|nr:chlorite dismutase family protein [Pyrinomonadaceae bacterium]